MMMKNKLLVCYLVAVEAMPLKNFAQQPNIVFVLVDDLGWQDVGFNGSKYYETPNLDRLAAESVVFKRAYMYPTCSPSRAALLTGKQSFRTGVYTVPVIEKGDDQENIFSRWTVEKKHDFYSRPLNDAGYKLIHLGKWHVVGPDPLSETNFPLKEKLKQPKWGNFDWLDKHKSPEIQGYYPIAKGFHENVGGTWWGDPARGVEG
jgi:arylsulfatase A-like enzyme